jgi:hypothetical protein
VSTADCASYFQNLTWFFVLRFAVRAVSVQRAQNGVGRKGTWADRVPLQAGSTSQMQRSASQSLSAARSSRLPYIRHHIRPRNHPVPANHRDEEIAQWSCSLVFGLVLQALYTFPCPSAIIILLRWFPGGQYILLGPSSYSCDYPVATALADYH